MKKKNFSLIYVSIFLLMIIIICVVLFVLSYKNLKDEVKKTTYNTMYGNVLEIGKNYIKVKDTNSNDVYYLKYSKNDISDNDIILIKYKDSIDEYEKIEVIVNSEDEINIEDTTKMTEVSMPTTYKQSSKVVTHQKTTTVDSNNDETIIASVRESYNLVDSSNETTISENVKNKFIEIVDFIFYGKEIKGRTFESLSMEAKGKIIYYALLIDAKIDSKWPQYKENISEKYNDIKAKLLAKYLDLSTKACASDEHACEVFKKDFSLLKSSLKITWELIKSAFRYAYDKTSNAIVEWYEVFSGKV